MGTGRDTRSRGWLVRLGARLKDTDPDFKENAAGVKVKQYALSDLEAAFGGYTGWVGQIERGHSRTTANEDGYLHWQIYVENENPVRFSALQKRVPQGEIQAKKGTRAQAVGYVSKADTRVLGPFWFGSIKVDDYQGKRSDLDDLRNAVIEEGMPVRQLVLEHPKAWRHLRNLEALESIALGEKWAQTWRDVRVEYHWGLTRTGKTRGVYERYGYRDVCRITDYGRGGFDHYGYEGVLVLDEFRAQLPIGQTLALLEGHPYQLPARYANKWSAYTTVVIISNEPLGHQYTRLERDADGGEFRRSLISAETRAAFEARISRVVEYTAEVES